MEAMAALAVLFAFWRWRHDYRHPIAFELVVLSVTVASAFVVGTVVSGATESNHRHLYGLSRVLGVLNVLMTFWFVSVEEYWFFEDCPNCRHSRSFTEYRFLSFVLKRIEGRDSPTLMQWVAADLGIPCSHNESYLWLKHRWSGLCLLVEDGGLRLSNDLTYPPCAARRSVPGWQTSRACRRRFGSAFLSTTIASTGVFFSWTCTVPARRRNDRNGPGSRSSFGEARRLMAHRVHGLPLSKR